MTIPLNATKIQAHLPIPNLELIVLEQIHSTNSYLKETLLLQSQIHPAADTAITACLAETQTHGRGRLNHTWYSPAGKNIYLSIRYPIKKAVRELSGLSLVAGLAACTAIESNCKLPCSLQLKWPNDIFANSQKLAGILLEIQPYSQEQSYLILGIGVNVNMESAAETAINQAWTSLRQLSGEAQDRNLLAAALIQHITQTIGRFLQHGLADFMLEWNQRDYLAGKMLQLTTQNNIVTGIATGINSQGHLLVNLASGGQQAFLSGEVTLAPPPA